jgi:hypothetical protein
MQASNDHPRDIATAAAWFAHQRVCCLPEEGWRHLHELSRMR